MSLQEIQQQNNERRQEINSLLDAIHQKISAAYSELQSVQATVKDLQIEKTDLLKENSTLKTSLEKLKEDNKKELDNYTTDVALLQQQYNKLKELIKTAQETYSVKVRENNTLADNLEDEKKDLKEREISLNAKLRAYKKDREDLNFEKRRFEAEKGSMML